MGAGCEHRHTEKKRKGEGQAMAEKEERARSSILPVLLRTPIRSLGTPRRVLVDSKGREVSKNPRKNQGTPLLNPSPASRPRQNPCNPADWSTPSCKSHRIQASPCSARRHSMTSKLNVNGLSSQISASQKLKQQSLGHRKEGNSYVLQQPEVVTQKENRLVKENIFVKEQTLDKENIPLKEDLCSQEGIATPRTPFKGLLQSEWSRFSKREKTLLSPALRIKVEDVTEDAGGSQEERVLVPQNGIQSEGDNISQQLPYKSLDTQVKKKMDALLHRGRKTKKSKEWL